VTAFAVLPAHIALAENAAVISNLFMRFHH